MSSGAAGPFYLPNSEAAVVWFLRIPASVSCCYYFFFFTSATLIAMGRELTVVLGCISLMAHVVDHYCYMCLPASRVSSLVKCLFACTFIFKSSPDGFNVRPANPLGASELGKFCQF